MVKVKICGLRTQESVWQAVEAGADALGVVFHPKSSRYVTPTKAAEILKGIPPFVLRVGLFVNTSREEIRAALSRCPLDLVQLHGDESPMACRDSPVRVIKAIRVREAADLKGLERFPVDGLLLDAKVEGAFGGTGQSFDWSLLADYRCPRPLILAGGLSPGNVTEAIRRVRPYAVDVSSGVESSPGVKDGELMRRFVQRAREAG